MGKTSLALTMAANVARLNDCAVGVFSLEMPAQELVERLLASTAKVNMLDLKRNMPTFETDPDRFFKVMERMGDAVAAMDNTIIHVDDQPGLTLADVRHRTRNLERQVKDRRSKETRGHRDRLPAADAGVGGRIQKPKP